MSTVNNKTALKKLAMNPIKTNIKKYIILIIAVVMTTLLFSSLFTIAGSMLIAMVSAIALSTASRVMIFRAVIPCFRSSMICRPARYAIW